jgi:hypothetical protein
MKAPTRFDRAAPVPALATSLPSRMAAVKPSICQRPPQSREGSASLEGAGHGDTYQ